MAFVVVAVNDKREAVGGENRLLNAGCPLTSTFEMWHMCAWSHTLITHTIIMSDGDGDADAAGDAAVAGDNDSEALRRWRQDNQEFKVIFNFRECSRLDWTI